MPPASRSSDNSPGKAIPALVNQGYFSDYYLAYRLDAGLEGLYKRWDAAEKEGTATPRTRVRSLTTALDKYRLDAVLTAVEPADDGEDRPVDLRRIPADGLAAQRDLNDAVLTALGWTPNRDASLELISGDRSFTVPVAARCDTHAGTVLAAVETVFATDPSTVVASKQAPAGTLLEPVVTGERVEARTALEAAQVVFTADSPPTYLLVVSGGSIILLDRDRWGEGIYLAANLDDALARHDAKPRGELAAIAALFSADVINPGDDVQSLLSGLLDRAANEAAGVSKDLRHGVRRSVELLANAVVRDVRERQHGAWRSIDPKDLTRQCLRYLYRVIVLLFAEARPELGILPVDDPDYQSGYSLARLRDVALRDLHTDHGRNANHLQNSLSLLFRLVNDGYEPESTLDADDSRGLRFRPLRSVLFSEAACPLIDRSLIPDEVLQRVLEHLCFSQEKSGRQRQALSYATLGINQLGAVYEGLMAYTGFLATEPLHEIDKDGDADNGSWVIPVHRADEFLEDVLLTEEGPGGERRRVRYETGDFVFRLSGRDRQRSASYYTPEVLTEFTVRHALDVFFAENPALRAAEILNLTICEPALGSGAFLNEAINQLAARYLKAAQDEIGRTIDPDRYQHELQKAKAHFAVNQAFGVDLNQTAVELAEISLWLNCMHAGLDAPWFGARLRRGNSLVGARRATYSVEQVKNTVWTGKTPAAATDDPVQDVPLGEATGIHHFLVPGEGWGAAVEVREIKELNPDWVETVKAWRKAMCRKPSSRHIERLNALAQRVELLWKESAQEVRHFWAATRHHIEVWGGATEPQGSHYGTESIRRVLYDMRSATCRLRAVMNAWCSLWVWAPQHGTGLPTFDQWLDGVEAILGRPDPSRVGVLFLTCDDGTDRADGVEKAENHFPWLAACREIAEAQAWFHWQLDFAPVFERGGFHIQIGNPPWVRPTWDDSTILAEYDPYFGVTEKIPEPVFRERRTAILGELRSSEAYQAERAENAGLNALLAAGTREPLLLGLQTNLYMVFMTNSWSRCHASGTVSLIHPESHFIDPSGGPLREVTYRRLRRHWHFSNATLLFPEIGDRRAFGVNVYGPPRSPSFIQASTLLDPAIADRSLTHDGAGDPPGIQYPEGGYDLRPHKSRIVTVDQAVLEKWVKLFDAPDTPANQARLVRPLTTADLAALLVFAQQPSRLANQDRYWTSGFHEKGAKADGTFEWRTGTPASLEDCVLQGPHILNGTPFAQVPRIPCKSNNDWDPVDLENLQSDYIPRTNFSRLVSEDAFRSRLTKWDGVPYTLRFRSAHREFVESGTVRALQACILPPPVPHIYKIDSIYVENDVMTARWAGCLMSLPYDFLIKTSGVNGVGKQIADALPIPAADPVLDGMLLFRVARLNCLTSAYGPLWSRLFDPRWLVDGFMAGEGSIAKLSDVGETWSSNSPLRRDYDRWLAFCEIDAIVACLLGMTCEQLLQMYRSQFARLRKYEHYMVFDGAGRQVCAIHHAFGFQQAQWEATQKARRTGGAGNAKLGMWDRVQAYLAGDTSTDLGPFLPPFRPADREAAMSRAYQALVRGDKLGAGADVGDS